MREQAGMTQTDLAVKLGRTQSFVTQYETHRRRIDFVELLAILRVFRVTLSEFATRYEERARKRS
jgi:transcriptional regulator with XRE-family HTH domain